MNGRKINSVLFSENNYPASLREIPNPPREVFYLGDFLGKTLVEQPKIAIVGTRKATAYGRAIAKEIACSVAQKGIAVISGLATGIDTAAHEGALLNKGKTIAVLACGLDTVYPRQNENLAKKIIGAGGAIISEYPEGSEAFKNQFLERNRIISGLSAATIVIEAPERSGALVTARLAAEQGKEVFIVPGPMNHPNYVGSHKLVRDGARLISSLNDVFEDLSWSFEETKSDAVHNLSEEEKIIFKLISEQGDCLKVDKIVELIKLEPQKVNQILAILVIRGIIKETEQGYTI